MRLEAREGNLAQADWYYADLESPAATGMFARFRRNQRDSRIQGPLTLAQLQQLASSGRVDRHRTMIWRPQWNRWQPAGEVQTLFSHQSPPPLPAKLVERGIVFRSIEATVYFAFSLVLSIPLAILSGLVRVAKFVFYWLQSIFGLPASVDRTSGSASAVAGRQWTQSESLMFWRRAAMLSQIASCSLGIIALFAFEPEPWFMFGVAWLSNLAIWTVLMKKAWAAVPAKYHPTDERTMLYWMLVPGLSAFGWYRLIPELGEAAYRIGHPGTEPPVMPSQMSKLATVMCFIPVLNIVGGLILLPWLAAVGQDLRSSTVEANAWA